jgi:hypothetical protein
VSDLWDKLERAYQVGIEAPGKEVHFLILLALVITFGIVRLITHAIHNQSKWWPGHDLETKSGLHIHHMVPGILLIMFCGYLGLSVEPGTPWRELLAVAFGVGLGLTLDEFALWLNLEDVYWQHQGRESVDAVIVAASLLVITFIGLPFWTDVFEAFLTTGGMKERVVNDTSTAILVTVQVIAVLLAAVAIYKGKRLLAIVGVFVPLVALTAAVRLAKPRSRWARRFYSAEKLHTAQHRFSAEHTDPPVVAAPAGGGA